MEIKDKEPKLSNRDKRFMNARSIMDFGMGVLWFGMGIFLIFIKRFNTGLEAQFNDPVMKVFGGICVIYGGFRIYRAIKKNYFK